MYMYTNVGSWVEFLPHCDIGGPDGLVCEWRTPATTTATATVPTTDSAMPNGHHHAVELLFPAGVFSDVDGLGHTQVS